MNNPPNDILVFCLGCIGSLAPEIVRLYKLRNKPPKTGFSAFYFVITAIYAALGGTMAICLPSVTLHAALYAGVTTPITISAIIRNKSDTVLAANEKKLTSAKSKRLLSELLRTHANGLFGQDTHDLK